MSRYAYDEPWNDRLEIAGDAREDIERTEGYEACPVAPESDEDVDGHHADYLARYGDEGPSEEMDGDHESALSSAGFGTDEDYGSFGGEDDWLDGSYEDA